MFNWRFAGGLIGGLQRFNRRFTGGLIGGLQEV